MASDATSFKKGQENVEKIIINDSRLFFFSF